MFRGSAPAKVDQKGRLKIPTDFRRELEERSDEEVFITSIDGRSALVYPMPVWEGIESRLLQLPPTDRIRERFLERVNYFGQQVRLDAQGRVLIPQLLRDAAEMNGETVVSGRLDHLVVWNREQLEQRLADNPLEEEDLEALSERNIWG
jgi:MraZ protein